MANTVRSIRTPLFTTGAAVLFSAALAANAHGAVIAEYGFGVAAGTDAPTTVLSGVAASSISIGVAGTEFGTLGDSQGNGYSSQAPVNAPGSAAASFTRYVRAVQLEKSVGAALDSNDFFAFTLTPDDGNALDLTSLTLDIAITSQAGTTTGFYALYSSVDDYADMIDVVSATRVNSGTSDYVRQSIGLSDFQQVDEAITFRLYLYRDSGDDQAVLRFDNLTINGDVAPVPEPATGLLAAAALALLPRRRRA